MIRILVMAAEHETSPLEIHDVPRAQRLLTLEFGSRSEFEDPSLEYRRLFSELLGTFMLVLVAAGGGLLHAKGQISLAAAVVAPGLMVLAIILFMGAVSGAHLNPAVSVAFSLRGRPLRRNHPSLRCVVSTFNMSAIHVPVENPSQVCGANSVGCGLPSM